jgi:hypothetical protein
MLTLCHLKRTDQPPNAASGLGVEPLVDGADRGHGVVTHRGFVERPGPPLGSSWHCHASKWQHIGGHCWGGEHALRP